MSQEGSQVEVSQPVDGIVDVSELQQMWLTAQDWLFLNGVKIVVALLILFIGRSIARLLTNVIEKTLVRNSVDPTIISFTRNVSYAAMLTFVVIASLGQVGIQTASFVAVIGAAGLAIGLALQGSLANFASGVLMLIFKPFKAGDFIEAGGTAGVVEEIHVFSTQLRSPDNKTLIVPNSAIMGGNIVNYSTKPTRRVDLVVGVSYEADLAHVKLVLQDIIKADDRVLTDPAPVIAVSELADSSVNLVVRPWVKSADYWDVYFGLTERIKVRFDEEGIGIPYPQMDLHVASANVPLVARATETA